MLCKFWGAWVKKIQNASKFLLKFWAAEWIKNKQKKSLK